MRTCMTTTRFIPLIANETLKDYPQYFREDSTCFLILKDQTHDSGKLVGLYGLIDRGIDPIAKVPQAEAFLTIFPVFRYQTLSKGFFFNLFDHAFDSGFDKVYTWTKLASWQKLFERFEPLGIQRLDRPPLWDLDPGKVWFVKEKDQQPFKQKEPEKRSKEIDKRKEF